MNKYLIMFDRNASIIIEAEDYVECIIKFAKSQNEYSPLCEKAMYGLSSPKDFIEMYNHFAFYHIRAMFEIKEILFNVYNTEKG